MQAHRLSTHVQRRDDRGAVLPLVLVFVVVLAVIGIALASYAATALRSSDVTDHLVSRLTAAESGMQYALADAAAAPAACNGTPTVRSPINGASVSTTCWRVPELEALDTLFALVLTGEGPDGEVDNELALEVDGSVAAGGVKDILGPVFVAAPAGGYLSLNPDNLRVLLPDPYAPATEVAGIVRYQANPAPCPAPTAPVAPADFDGTPLLPPSVTCDNRSWSDVVPDLNFSDASLGIVGAIPTAPAPDTSGPSCDIYFPGEYATPPTITRPSFFVSGVYYFAGGEVRIDDQVVVGKRVDPGFPDAATAGLSADCTTDWNNAGDTGGAVWMMGTDARIFVTNNSKLNFYGRSIADESSPDPVVADRTVVALTTTQATRALANYGRTFDGVTLPIDIGTSPAPDKLIDRANGGNTSMSFYGQVYAPNSWIDTGVAASDVYVEFLGGIVAGRLAIMTPSNVDGFNISVPTSVQNVFYIESSATSTGVVGTSTATVRTRSIEEVDALSGQLELSVDSWRVCERDSC